MTEPGGFWSRRSHRLLEQLDTAVGGPARRQVAIVLSLVLALSSADTAAVGSTSAQLQHSLGIDKTQVGLLLSVTGLVGAFAAVWAGRLVDRVVRVRMLFWAVLVWGIAALASGLATSFGSLLLIRVALGAVTAVAGPSTASLIGDFIPAADRGRVYSTVLGGELIGTGFGFIVSGELAAVSWRLALSVLALPSLLVAFAVRSLPEPDRGGSSQLPVGAEDLTDVVSAPTDEQPYPQGQDDQLMEEVRREHIQPDYEHIPQEDPAKKSLVAATRYLLSIKTNLVLIIAGALSYFFLSGLQGFGVEFARTQFGVGQSVATLLTLIVGIGAFFGVLVGGRLSDRLLHRHHRLTARVEVGGWSMALTAVVLIPALLTGTLVLAVPFLLLGGFCQGGTNPPIDAARLDIVPPLLWGRAEGIRTVARSGAQAVAPLLFGYLAGHVFGGEHALRDTFGIMLVPLAASGLITVWYGKRTYPQDVATVRATAERLAEPG
jgi:MFS family permease